MQNANASVFIINAVLTNNGDAALVFGLHDALRKEGVSSTILTMHYDQIKDFYGNYPLVRDRSSAWIFIKLPWLRSVFARWQMKTFPAFREAAVILGCPGGYMNSTYGVANKLALFREAKQKGKRSAIYAQSFGPFTAFDQELMRSYQGDIDVMMARDGWSVQNLVECGVDATRIMQSNDAAFLLDDLSSLNQSRRVAVSVRDWKADGRDTKVYERMMVAMIESVVMDGYDVVMLSTCQGLPGYVDDSKCAQRIVGLLSDDVRQNVQVDSGYHTLDELRELLRHFHFTIGTRLHMCVLSMKSGTPALNISYEEKGRAMYEYLGFKEYTIDYNGDSEQAVAALKKFGERIEELRPKVWDAMQHQHTKALEHLRDLLKCLGVKPQ
ncbi:MAG: polysaccharide pyruvyl transferase family protein [Flavobacteriales bacterium]|nr:polysaccharide pyruvyl transferase family protein [Flavobacteriales bacterium]